MQSDVRTTEFSEGELERMAAHIRPVWHNARTDELYWVRRPHDWQRQWIIEHEGTEVANNLKVYRRILTQHRINSTGQVKILYGQILRQIPREYAGQTIAFKVAPTADPDPENHKMMLVSVTLYSHRDVR
jgi:hypothetical protein